MSRTEPTEGGIVRGRIAGRGRGAPRGPDSARSPGRRRRWGLGVAALLAVVSSVLAGCGAASGPPKLTWYINPDPNPPAGFKGPFGQAGIASRCSTDEYSIDVQLLPQSASEQRVQLLRRLAAKDSSIDMMSLDPVFTAEFAAAKFLHEIPADAASTLSAGMLKGALDGASWDGKLVVVPLWANTQVLWYRKSVAAKAGLDMAAPVTWDQIIGAAEKTNTTVGVQANKYEGYVVWINALVLGAGGNIVTDTAKGSDATVTIGDEAGKKAAAVVQKLASSSAKEPDLSVSNEGTVLGPFGSDRGGFMLNWTFAYNNYKADEAVFKDVGFARYPETVAGTQSRPPLGGINVGISRFSKHPDLAMKAVACMTSEENQIQYAVETGNMPAREAAYTSPQLTKDFPQELLNLYRDSMATGGPRPASAYWSTIVNATLNRWHPANSVNQNTPEKAADFIKKALKGEVLL